MKTIIRNLLSVIRRFKMATILNVLGLSVAFAAFMVIMMQINYDRTFDRSNINSNCIFRLEFVNDGQAQAVISRPFADAFFASSPHIKAGALINEFQNTKVYIATGNSDNYNYKEQLKMAYSTIPQVFGWNLVEGSLDMKDTPKAALIPESMAKRLFVNEPATGKVLKCRTAFITSELVVCGVYKDLPQNSAMENIIYMPIYNENLHVWSNWNYEVYVRLDSPDAAKDVIDNFKKNFNAKEKFGDDFSWGKSGADIRLTALPEVHFETGVIFDTTPKASRQTLWVLFAIAIAMLLIAGINYMNFSTAMTPMRIKSINTQKVLGSTNAILRRSLLAEAVIISLCAYLLALVFVYLFAQTSFASLIDAKIILSAYPKLVFGTAMIAVGVGLLAGLYPAFYMTSFQPALVLKGSFGLSPKGRRLRNILMGTQFVASFALIIGALFMYLQNYYMQHSSLGYDKDALIVTDVTNKINESTFSNQLKSFSGIEDVTFAQTLISSGDQYMGWGRKYHDKDIHFGCLSVSPSFLKVMGIKVLEGRDFREEDAKTKHGVFIFNELAKSKYNLQLNDMGIDSAEIVGFMQDVKFASFRTKVEPMAFYVWGTENWGMPITNAYIKVKPGSDMHAAMDHVKSTLKQLDGEYQFNVRFFDDVLNKLYEKETRLSQLITLFSLITVFISIVGVFGLVVFDSEYRRKEIGVRKVFGSTTRQILIMFNKTYIKIVLICFVIATPVAYFAVAKWLENFAYKTPLYWWVFLISFIVVALVTFATVTFQNWRSANANPVDSLKSE